MSEEEAKHQFYPVGNVKRSSSLKPEFTQSLDDSRLSTLSSLFHREDSAHHHHHQQQDSPTSSPVPMMMLSDEQGEASSALTQLDDFLDILSDTTSDRIEQQRSPLPLHLSQKTPQGAQGAQGDAATVPKYYLPTNPQMSSLVQHSAGGSGGCVMTPPSYSVQNLSVQSVAEVDEDSDIDDDSSPTSSNATPPSPIYPSQGGVGIGPGTGIITGVGGMGMGIGGIGTRVSMRKPFPHIYGSSLDVPPPVSMETYHGRSVSFDGKQSRYNESISEGEEDVDILKSRSAVAFGETDELVDDYWRTTTPPSPPAAITPSPPLFATSPPFAGGPGRGSGGGDGGGGGGGGGDGGVVRCTSPLARTSYSSQGRGSPDRLNHHYYYDQR